MVENDGLQKSLMFQCMLTHHLPFPNLVGLLLCPRRLGFVYLLAGEPRSEIQKDKTPELTAFIGRVFVGLIVRFI